MPSKKKTDGPPPPVPSAEPGDLEDETLTLAAEALTEQYMKLRVSGTLKGPQKPPAPGGMWGPDGRLRTSPKKPEKKINPLDVPIPPPKEKLYTPGPGAYNPQVDRFSEKCLHSCEYSFGGGTLGQKDRSFIKHYISQQCSPGPMYTPNRETTSTLKSIESHSFQRNAMDHTNSNFFNGIHSNSPCHNPGPQDYCVGQDRKGNKVEPGKHMPAHTFGTSSFQHPQDALKKTVYMTAGNERENYGIHSPGPIYNPDSSTVSRYNTKPSYTLRPKGTMVWDEQLKPKHTYGPGPMYFPDKDKKGGKELGCSPKYTFSRENQRPASNFNLSGTSFITETHAKVANQSVHSPAVGTYSPHKPKMHQRSANFKFQGPKDRFYDRFEPGRLM